MKVLLKVLLLFSLLLVPSLAQRTVEPIRVSLTLAEDDSDAQRFNECLRAELNKQSRLVFVSKAVDFDVYVVSGGLFAGGKTVGHSAAVAVVNPRGRDLPISVMLVTGPNLKETARLTATRINGEYFDKR